MVLVKRLESCKQLEELLRNLEDFEKTIEKRELCLIKWKLQKMRCQKFIDSENLDREESGLPLFYRETERSRIFSATFGGGHMGEGGGRHYNPDRLFNIWYKAYGLEDQIDGQIYECESEKRTFEYLQYCLTMLPVKEQELLNELCVEWRSLNWYAARYNVTTRNAWMRKHAALEKLLNLFNDEDNLHFVNEEANLLLQAIRNKDYLAEEFGWSAKDRTKRSSKRDDKEGSET